MLIVSCYRDCIRRRRPRPCVSLLRFPDFNLRYYESVLTGKLRSLFGPPLAGRCCLESVTVRCSRALSPLLGEYRAVRRLAAGEAGPFCRAGRPLERHISDGSRRARQLYGGSALSERRTAGR